jgi:hypothetical protein
MAKQRTAAELQKQLDALDAQMKANQAKGLDITNSQAEAYDRIEKLLKRQIALQNEALHTTKEMDETLGSISSSWGKTNKLFQNTDARLSAVNIQANKLVGFSSKIGESQKAVKLGIEGAAAGYKKTNAEVYKNIAALAEGQKLQGAITGDLEEQIAAHKEIIKSVHGQDTLARSIRKELRGEVEEMEKLAKAAKAAEKDISAIQREGEKFAGTMVGGALDKTMKAFGSKKGVGGLIEKVAGDRAGGGLMGNMMGGVAKFLGPIGLAVGGIMAAAEFFDSGGAAKMAMRLAVLTGDDPMNNENVDKAIKQSKGWRDLQVEKYYKTPLKLQQQSESDYLEYKIGVEDDAAKYKESLIRDEIDYRMGLEQDAIQFRQQQASAELDAQLSRQKTLFTSGMGYMKQAIGISERALMAIGSSTAAVLDTVKEYGYTLGIALKDQIALSAAAQGLAVRYGSSATDVFKMADTFRLMNKTSAKTGANLVAGLEDLAKKNDMSPAQLYKEMADAQADILKYSSYTTEEYARQAIQLGNMNTSMANMLKASDSMVLNYKDSIKAEMSLSAMLGKNVNFAEVRAKLMSGDQAGGAAALKTALGGQDINAMNAFQKQALSQATGMGIQELMQLTQSKGGDAKGTLEERNARKTGAAIAKGALQQDIANAAAKLALDQKNRAEMLKFEQAKRMAMLFVEQKFKLNAIEREIKYRKDREEQNQKVAEENYKMSLMGEVASEQIMQLSSAYTDAKNAGKISEAQLSQFKAETMKSQDVLQQAMTHGFIQDSEIADIALKRFEAAQKGEMFDINKIAGVQKFNEAYKKSADSQNLANQQMIKNFEDFRKLEKGADTEAGFKKWREMETKMNAMYPKMMTAMNRRGAKGESRDMFMKWMKSTRGTNISNVPGGSTVNAGKGGKPSPVVLTPPKSGTKTDAKGTPISLPKEAPKLSDTQAQTKLQVQMVKLIGVSAQYLAQIDAKTTGEGGKIDGKLVANSLLNAANRQYGVAGVSY